ncbi:MAG: hypothetical protein ACK4TB_05625 [Gemmobacter sp.]
MSDRVALALGVIVVAAIAADMALDTGAVLFLLRKLAVLVDWLVFWR